MKIVVKIEAKISILKMRTTFECLPISKEG